MRISSWRGYSCSVLLVPACASALLLCDVGISLELDQPRSPRAADLVSPTGCAVDAPAGHISGLTVTDGRGQVRKFDIFVTKGYSRNQPVPLLMVLHGIGGSSTDAIDFGYDKAVVEAGDPAIIVMPQGVDFKAYGVGWNQHCGGYDMPFFDAMVREVSTRYCIDPRRIFASGFSWGADMVDALACCRGDVLRAVAPFSGDEVHINPRCPSATFPAARIRYGTALGKAGDGVYTRAQFLRATEFFRRAQSCTTQSDPIGSGACVEFRGCKQPVVDCERIDLGHVAPSPAELAETWRFLQSLP